MRLPVRAAKSNVERHARQRRVAAVAEQRRERRVGVDHAVAERRGHARGRCRRCRSAGTDKPPVASDHAIGRDVTLTRVDRPRRAGAARGRSTLVSNWTRTPRARASASSPSRTSRARFDRGKSLPDSSSSASGMPTSCSKNCALFVQRPRPQHPAHEVRRRAGDEAFGREHRRQDVAAAAAADQDFLVRRRRCARSAERRRHCDAAKIAATRPAAPAPTTATDTLATDEHR